MNREERLTRKFYAAGAEREWARLGSGALHALEFETTLDVMKRHLPRRGLILDAGGGPGRYTIEAAKRGYDVVLFDLVKANLDVAAARIRRARVGARVRELVAGSITDLSRFEDGAFDAVLCTGGPLSHVHPESARRRAIRELVRVARPGAPIFASVIGRFAAMSRGVSDWPGEYEDPKALRLFWKHGDDYRWCGRHFAHFFTADELAGLFPKNVTRREIVGLEGLASAVGGSFEKFATRSPRALRNWMEAHRALRTHPAVVDVSAHILFVGERRATGGRPRKRSPSASRRRAGAHAVVTARTRTTRARRSGRRDRG